MSMRPKCYPLLEQCLGEGLNRASYRFWKHRDDGPPDYLPDLTECMVREALTELCEWFDIDDSEEEPE